MRRWVLSESGTGRTAPSAAQTPAQPAARAIAEDLPEAVSAAVIDFITGSLIENPRRVGQEIRNELAGIHSARRGSYRILYRIDKNERTLTVLRGDHRSSSHSRRSPTTT